MTSVPPPARRAPGAARLILLAGVSAVLLTWCIAAWIAVHQPCMGLTLTVEAAVQAGTTGSLRVVESGAAIPPGSRLVEVQGAGMPPVALRETDLIEEPDLFPDYAQWRTFYERQDALAAAQRSARVALRYEGAQGAKGEAVVAPAGQRPLSSLPFVFWFQLAVGGIGALVGAWVLALRPSEAAARCLALTGLALLGAASTAAVYSTRELAMPADLFRTLSTINHLSTGSFGIGLVGIFLFHPRPLPGAARVFWAVAAVCTAWIVADVSWWIPSPDFAMRLLALCEMLGAIALGIWQWRRSRGNLVDRAALRWVLLSFLVGCGAFIALIVCTTLLGWIAPVSQGYAFGFFLLMYMGLALGVRRYRLFDMDRWSLRVLLWVFGVLGIMLLDGVFLLMRWSEALSLSASVLVCAALYFPLRQWLWARLFRDATPGVEELSGKILALGLLPPAQRANRWKAFLLDVYAPLRVEDDAGQAGSRDAVLLDQGMGLYVPAVAGLPPLTLWGRQQGRRLFSSQDAVLAGRLLHLVGIVFSTRDAHEQGALQERMRIAGDLHDDLGGKLLTIAHSSESPAVAALARQALDDMRLAVQGMMAGPADASEVLADWRSDTVTRAQAAGLQVAWDTGGEVPEVLLQPRLRMHATRMLREAVTNAIRHSGGSRLEVRLRVDAQQLAIRVRDDGKGLQPGATPGGTGLGGMQRRAQALGGQCRVTGLSPGLEVDISLPLAAVPDNPTP